MATKERDGRKNAALTPLRVVTPGPMRPRRSTMTPMASGISAPVGGTEWGGLGGRPPHAVPSPTPASGDAWVYPVGRVDLRRFGAGNLDESETPAHRQQPPEIRASERPGLAVGAFRHRSEDGRRPEGTVLVAQIQGPSKRGPDHLCIVYEGSGTLFLTGTMVGIVMVTVVIREGRCSLRQRRCSFGLYPFLTPVSL